MNTAQTFNSTNETPAFLRTTNTFDKFDKITASKVSATPTNPRAKLGMTLLGTTNRGLGITNK